MCNILVDFARMKPKFVLFGNICIFVSDKSWTIGLAWRMTSSWLVQTLKAQVGWSMSKFWPGTDLGGHCINLVPAIAKLVASVNLPKFTHQGSSLQSNSSMQFNTKVSLSFSLLIWTIKMETLCAFLTFKQNPGDLEPYLSLEEIWHLFYAVLICANWLGEAFIFIRLIPPNRPGTL